MMDTNAIIGLDSAYICAQETGCGNMQISAGLVVELIDRLRAAEAERQELHHAQNSLLDRLSDLTAYKEAAEKQDPVGRVKIEDSWCGGGEFHAQIDEDLPDGTLLYAKPVPADKPARITEQDAMAILLEWDAYRAERSASGVTPAHFKKWLSLVGRDLLAKLNAENADSSSSQPSAETKDLKIGFATYCALTFDKVIDVVSHHNKIYERLLSITTTEITNQIVREINADHCPSHESEHKNNAPYRSDKYFYKVNDCKADSPQSPDCKCWHDYGAGPLPNLVKEGEQGGAV